MRRQWTIVALALLGLAIASSPASAVLLVNGGFVAPTPGGTVAPIAPSVPPSTLVTTFTQTQAAGDYTATLREAVVREASGTLSFLFQVSNLAGGTSSIGRVTADGFAGFTADVDYVSAAFNPVVGFFVAPTPTGTSAFPTSIDRSSTAVNNGRVIGFNFSPAPPKIDPGETSVVFYVRTNARLFTNADVNTINGAVASFNAFGPTAVPEPSTLALALVGVPAAGLWYRRRGRRA